MTLEVFLTGWKAVHGSEETLCREKLKEELTMRGNSCIFLL
uniref:Uncharacterized protein n=1 Tax=Chlorobium phaeobacteroides (strain BS1) TaxID=331678 RepID=B3EM76_CHLPB